MAAGRFLGERLFGHWLEGRLQRQKQEDAVELEKLKNEQNREIEKQRADIGHQQDRGKHSNEREYAALTEIWEKFTDLHTLTNICIRGFVQIPDLERMATMGSPNPSTKTFHRRRTRRRAKRREQNDGFSRVCNDRAIALARRAYFDFRLGSISRIFSSRNPWRTVLPKRRTSVGGPSCSGTSKPRSVDGWA